MICSMCRTAGLALNRGAMRTPDELTTILELHEQCKGGTWCDCHHQLAGVDWPTINREAANADR